MKAEKFVDKKEPKRLPVWACIPLFVAAFFIIWGVYSTISYGFLSVVIGADARHPGVGGYILLEASMLLAILTAAVIMLHFERRPFADLGLSVKGHVRGIWYGLLVAAFIYLAGFGLSLLMGEIEVTGCKFEPLSLFASWVFFLLVALSEEIMMRGYILGRLLHTQLNKFLSLFISSVLFALMHIFNSGIDILPLLNLVLAGMLLGASYLYTRNLVFPVSLHLFWNWIQGPVLGYKVSGSDFVSPMLTLSLPENNLLNGGAFGFEGSLICTVLIIFFTIMIIWWGEKRDAINLAVRQSC